MAINRLLREDIQKKFTELSRRRVDQKIKEFSKERKISNRDIAAYAFAWDELGINIESKKYSVDESTLTKVQNVLQSGPQIIVKGKKSSSKKSKIEKPMIYNFTDFKIEDHFLPKKLADEAEFMAKKAYPIIYVYENSIRNFILIILEKKHGKDWWSKATISTTTTTKVQQRMSDENRNKWHGKRGAHQIYYTGIDDLKNIITNNWNDFKSYLNTSQQIIVANIEIIEQSRNVVSHNNPLSKDDLDSVIVHFKQWIKLIKNIKL